MLTQTRSSHTQVLPLLEAMGGERWQLPYKMYPADPVLQRRCTQIEVQSQRSNLPVQYAFSMPYLSQPQRYPGDQYDWWLMDIQCDPIYRWDADGFPMPKDVLERLYQIQQAGLEFDTLCIAHEVEKGRFAPEQPPSLQELLPPPSQEGLQASATMGTVAQALWTVATLPLLAVGGLATMGAGAATALASLDPILFGVLGGGRRPLRESETAAFFYLAHWRYNEGSGV